MLYYDGKQLVTVPAWS